MIRRLIVAVATVGNTLGSVVNWLIGRGIAHFRERPWFPLGPERYEAASRHFARYGIWSLLLAWLPVIGDPITLVAGALGVPFGERGRRFDEAVELLGLALAGGPFEYHGVYFDTGGSVQATGDASVLDRSPA